MMAQAHNNAAVQRQQDNSPASLARHYTDVVEQRVAEMVRDGGLHLPRDYSAANAVRAAYLKLQDVQDKDKQPVLQVCTKHSIANALLNMVVQGLNVDKQQGYFIAYGKTLSFQRSYFGSMTLAMRVRPDITEDGFASAVVYVGDELEYEIIRGKRQVSMHKQRLENIDKSKIVAAYCEIYAEDGRLVNSELMTFEEIKQAWKQSKMYPIENNGKIKANSTHDKFTADMAIKTVINKACKPIINMSSDKALLAEVQRASELSDELGAQAEAEAHANRDFIDIAPEPMPEQSHALPDSHADENGVVYDTPEHQDSDPAEIPLLQPQTAQAQTEPSF